MTRLLRWQYTGPRLALAVVILLVVQLVMGGLVRRKVIQSGERSVGAKVEVGDARVSLLGGRITLRDVHVANPQSPLRNLIEADRCDIQLEERALLHKQTVVEQGVVTGLRFGTSRDTSGAISPTEKAVAVPACLDEQAIAKARDWLDRLNKQFERDLVDELESIRLTEQLVARWPQQYAELEQRIAALKERTTEFQSQVRQAQANPLRHVEFLDKMSDETARIRADLTMLSREVQDLPSLPEADRRAIVAARQHDEQFLREQLQFEKIDPNVLTTYLIQEQMSGPMADLVGWLRWFRRIVPAEKTPVAASHKRGHDITFAGCDRVPDLVIRSLDVHGAARLGGQPIELAGTLVNFSDDPALSKEPMRLRITTTGSLPLDLQATIDRTGPVAKDQLLVDCGGIVLPKLRLGGSDKLRLSLAPTTATLNVSITLEGDRLSGDVQLVQKQVQITPDVGDGLERARVASALTESLGDIRSLATRVTLRGTLAEPRWQIWSNVGPAVAEAMDRALARTANGYTRQLMAQSQQRVNEQLTQLDRHIADQQNELMPRLAGTSDSLDHLAGDSVGRLSFEQLGFRLPADSLFR